MVGITSKANLKRDSTCTQTRFGLSGNQTSPFKLVMGGQFSGLLEAEVWLSAAVMVVMLDTP